MEDDALPPPAYRPRPEPEVHAEPETFVAPRSSAGQPSGDHVPGFQAAAARSPAQTAPAPAAHAAEEERPRFGVRLADQPDEGPAGRGPAARRQPQVTSFRKEAEDPQHDPEQERIEIPAFLRRPGQLRPVRQTYRGRVALAAPFSFLAKALELGPRPRP